MYSMRKFDLFGKFNRGFFKCFVTVCSIDLCFKTVFSFQLNTIRAEDIRRKDTDWCCALSTVLCKIYFFCIFVPHKSFRSSNTFYITISYRKKEAYIDKDTNTSVRLCCHQWSHSNRCVCSCCLFFFGVWAHSWIYVGGRVHVHRNLMHNNTELYTETASLQTDWLRSNGTKNEGMESGLMLKHMINICPKFE